jgi:hypothetical protein
MTNVQDECEKLRRLGASVGAFVASKHESYGGAYTGGAALLRELAPEGVEPELFVAAILATRIFEKLRRFFVAPRAFNESPLVDVVGHALCLAMLYGAEPPPAPSGDASPDPADPGPADVGLARRLLARYLSGGDSGANEVDVQGAYRALGCVLVGAEATSSAGVSEADPLYRSPEAQAFLNGLRRQGVADSIGAAISCLRDPLSRPAEYGESMRQEMRAALEILEGARAELGLPDGPK